jgi:hypothetical protein
MALLIDVNHIYKCVPRPGNRIFPELFALMSFASTALILWRIVLEQEPHTKLGFQVVVICSPQLNSMPKYYEKAEIRDSQRVRAKARCMPLF